MATNILKTTLEVDDSSASRKLDGFRGKLENTEKQINSAGSKTRFADGFRKQFDDVSVKAGEASSKVRSHFNANLGSAIVGAFAFGTILTGLNSVISKALDAERATRKLSASAVEAGKSFAVLAEENANFARSSGLSQNASANIVARIQQLSNATGDPNQTAALQKGFLDLSSAKGIGTDELDNLIGTILSGQDEGLNRLGLADPSKLQAKYAGEIGKTVEQLTQFEKTQAAVNAVLEKAGVFTGANEERLRSLSGQMESARGKFEDLQTGIGSAITQSVEFRDAVGFLNDVLGSLVTSLTTVRAELAKGISPKDLAEREGGSGLNQILDAGKGAITAPIAALTIGYDLLFNSLEEAQNNFTESVLGANKRRIDSLERAFQAEKAILDKQAKDAKEQARIRAEKASEEAEKLRKEQAEKARREAQAAVEKSYQKRLSDPKRSVSGLRSDLASLSGADLEKDALEKLTADFTSKIEQAVEAGKNKIKELEKSSLGLFETLARSAGENNPFVSVYAEADKAILSVRENTKGLTEDLRNSILAFAETQNASKLFEARLDNALNVFDLRDSARAFREASRSARPRGYDDDFIKRAIEDPQSFGGSLSARVGGFDRLSAEQRRDIGETRLLQFGAGNLGLVGALASDRLRGSEVDDSATLRERLSNQLRIVNSLATDDSTRSIADRRLIALSQSVDPSQLDDTLREAFASAREREAIRLEKAEADAIKQREKQLATQAEISENLKRLVSIAEKDGLAGVEALIKIQDETGRANVEKRSVATPDFADVARAYLER